MGLFSFLFPKGKKLPATREVEMIREVFRENYDLFIRMESSEDLKRFQELDGYVNGPLFLRQRKEIEQLSYKGSEYHRAEMQYKSLLASARLKAYYLILASEELKGYQKIIASDIYNEYCKLKAVVTSAGFDRKLHAVEFVAYRKIIREPRIQAALRLEKNRKFLYYMEVKDTELPKEFEQLTAYIQSDEFKKKREFLLNKKRYLTTDDYKTLCEYEALRQRPDMMKYQALLSNPFFQQLIRWDMVFEDDFKNGRLDEDRWITRYYAGDRFLNDTYGVGNDIQLYTKDNISFQNGAACLCFRKEPIIGKYWDSQLGVRERKYEYTSGILCSGDAFRQRYGRFEAKIRLNHAGVLTQGFWMSGDMQVPHVDVMRCSGKGVMLGHVYPRHGGIADSEEIIQKYSLNDECYIFTLEWLPDRMTWMINDTVVKEIREDIPDVPMYLSFSLGATEVPAEKDLPGKMEIEWVKVYKLKNNQ